MYFDCFKVFINNVLCLIVSAVALACLIGFTVNLQILTLITKSRLNRCKFKHGLIYSLCNQSLKMRNKETNRDLAEFFGNKWDGFR